MHALGPAAVLSEAEIRALLATLPRRSPAGVRNRALVLVLWRTGLRIGEALALELRDVELDAQPRPRLRVRRGKGGRARTVGLHDEAAAGVELWLEQRRALGLQRARPLFCTFSSGRPPAALTRAYVGAMLKARAERAGLEVRVHPHAFRATLAVELVREGVPLPTVRDVLGHANVATTDAYLRRVFPADALEAVTERAGVDREAAALELARRILRAADAGDAGALRALEGRA